MVRIISGKVSAPVLFISFFSYRFCHPSPVLFFLFHHSLTPFLPARITFTAAMLWSLQAFFSWVIKSSGQQGAKSATSPKLVKGTNFMFQERLSQVKASRYLYYFCISRGKTPEQNVCKVMPAENSLLNPHVSLLIHSIRAWL